MLIRYGIFIFSLLALLFFSSSSEAGYITGPLEAQLASTGPNEFVRVLVIPESDYNPAVFKSALKEQYRTRAERHRAGIEQLKTIAMQSQQTIRNRLSEMQMAGKVRNVKALWITNLIEAEITVDGLRQLVSEPTILKIEAYPTVIPLSDMVDTRMALSFDTVGKNLRAIKADSAWAAGYDGRGRIVCSFDTGVDGLHPALSGNYRGNKGFAPSECWFSEVDSSEYPHDFAWHGTHTTGIIVGHYDDSNLVTGVAPGADWIAAVAIDVPGASIFRAFQWAADPDGDPNTDTDVPDVINHSWGIPAIGCADLLWQVIDNTEALGIVNIFAAGNSGPNPMTTLNPANRAEDSLTNFAVGALDTSMTAIWNQSSRGPSNCDGVSIKPNVVAPGMTIYSCYPGGAFGVATGTSGAAPHVAGAVAILRQKNPDATADEIKDALLNSAVDLGNAGPDNTFGWGRIDIMEALRRIDPLAAPSLQVASLMYPEIHPGDAISLDLALKNVGAAVNNILVTFDNPEAGITIVNGQIDFGRMEQDETKYGIGTLDLTFDPVIVPGAYYSLDMIITGNSYSDTRRLNFFVGTPGERTYYHHNTGRVRFTLSNYGAYGFHGTSGNSALTGSFIPLGFEGYQLDRDTNDLFEAALVIGTDSMHVSDCAKNIAQEPDNDFKVMPGGSIVAYTPGIYADQETVSSFDDSQAENPLGLTIEQRSYAWTDDPDNTFVILEYIITNNSKVGVNGIRVGLFFDWDIPNFYQNHGSFLPGENIGYLCWSANGDSADFRGIKVLNPEGLVNHRIYHNPTEIYYSNFTEARKYQGLADNSSSSFSTLSDVSHMTATGPFNLSVQQSDTAVFAIIGGADWSAFMASADRAEQKYNELPTDVAGDSPSGLPHDFTLDQNYPNPFNPATAFSFSLPRSGQVRVDIFDILGRTVRTLADKQMNAGMHTIYWDGNDGDGQPAASGIYLYRVRFEDGSLTRKMVMMK